VNAPVKVLLVPPGVVTVTFLAVRAAPFVIAQFAVTEVEVATIPRQVTPPPAIVTAVAPVRLVPVSVTGTVVLCVPVIGAIEVSVGAGGGAGPFTVNVTALLVPLGVVTVTFLAVSAALLVITQFAVTVVAVGVPVMVQVTPLPVAFTVVAPVRLVPVSVTGTVVPRTPDTGEIEVSVGVRTAPAPAASIAPTSTQACPPELPQAEESFAASGL
jgi:hypothetical protein